jgi:septum formation protein
MFCEWRERRLRQLRLATVAVAWLCWLRIPLLLSTRMCSANLGMLARLSGRSHRVLTGICLNTQRGEVLSEMVETKVHFLQLTREQCESYLATPEPWDKAGGYGIQGLAGAFVSSIEGSYSNVVGLPLAQTWQLLSGQGIKGALENIGE